MRRNAKQNNSFLKSAAVFAAVLLSAFMLEAIQSTMSDSLKDDVTAMITNAKKLPHTIFIIDTSESMNTFAYSDYVDNCKDGIGNLEKAIILCNNAYQQCRNVENNAMCDVNLGCGDVSTKCATLVSMKNQVNDFCTKVYNQYKEPSRTAVASSPLEDKESLKYVGPWNPSIRYAQDLCFYDWSKDTDGNVLNGTTTAQGDMNASSDPTDRRDWDCLTDGRGRQYNTDGTLGGSIYLDENDPNSGWSGKWLNWKYATSLDAVKIILADAHKFSFQPRYRGHNVCHKSVYYPENTYSEWDETANEGAGDYVDKKTCFIDFDTEFNDITDENLRLEQFKAMKDAIQTLWREVAVVPNSTEKADCTGSGCDPYEFKASYCANYSSDNGFKTLFPVDYDPRPTEDASSDCGRCMEWDKTQKEFVVKACSFYNGDSKPASSAKEFGSVSGDLTKTCCKTTECDNPHCRDNDDVCEWCADDDEDCKSGDDYGCALGYYSQFDQDKGHCCNPLTCAEEGETSGEGECVEWGTNEEGETYCKEYQCYTCNSNVTVGDDEYDAVTDDVIILEKPASPDDYYGSALDDGSIELTVFVSQFTAGLDPSDIESVTVTVNYDCNGYNDDNPDKSMLNTLGSLTLSGEDAAACGSLNCGTWLGQTCSSGDTTCQTNKEQCGNCAIQGSVSGCNADGYVASAKVNVRRKNCHFGKIETGMELDYIVGAYKLGKYEEETILDDASFFYNIFKREPSSKKTVVYEYECKTAFYHRQVLVVNGGSCPSSSAAPGLLNAANGAGSKVEYCDGRTMEREVIARDQWFNATKVACSWQCRDAIAYDDPWKCASFFYMMDDHAVHNGSDQGCISSCRYATGGRISTLDGGSDSFYTQNNTQLEDCCRCLNNDNGKYEYLEKPEGVTLSNGERVTCFVSGYQFGTASDGSTTTTSGYMAELVRGHINETPSGGSYALEPYDFGNSRNSPYSEPNGWYHRKSLVGEAGEAFVRDTFISAFATIDDAQREVACIYDILKYGWSGEDCNSCGTGCCAVDLSQNGNECDYPQFWMKVPMSEGGHLVYQAQGFTKDEYIKEFQDKISSLKAIGGSTLGETLYDVWRYLGGMYALHDPNHVKGGIEGPYLAPFENNDPTCFTNEAVVISGGQPEFDQNIKLKDYGVTSCTKMNNSTKSDIPCVVDTDGEPDKLHPYYQSNWHQTAFLNIANFVNKNTYWIKSDKDWCKDPEGSLKADGKLKDECIETTNNTGVDMARINHVHTISIGEWALAPLHSVTGTGTDDFLDSLYLRNAASYTGGKYYGLTAENAANANNGTGGTFNSLTDLFSDMMNKSQDTDVVSGRPHWTSSLVQPFDVEEKFRGPDSYSAGAIPIDGSVSRFWFGNLKKYQVDGDKCGIADDGECGEWKRQTVPDQDCFALEDSGADDFLPSDNTAAKQFRRLMAGGAAKKLWDKVLTGTCTEPPCIVSSPRRILTDNGSGTISVSGASAGGLEQIVDGIRAANPSASQDTVYKVLDYMAGYDAFDTNRRTKIRYLDDNTGKIKTFKVQDPINVDFNQTEATEITIRPLLLGAIIHSKPVAVYYDSTASTRIYAGANDGMLHAFDQNGEEVYAYIPSNAYSSIMSFAENQAGIFFNATVDGPITMLHIDQNHDGIINQGDEANDIEPESAYLIFGYRRGARGYTVIDISNPDSPAYVQDLNLDGGYSFAKAVVFRKCLKSADKCRYAKDLDYYLAVPGGYDTCNDPASLSNVLSENIPLCDPAAQRGIGFKIFHFNQKLGRFEDEPVFSSASMGLDIWLRASFTATPLAINTKGKAATDTEYVYFNDLSGTVFRVDVSSKSPSAWTGSVVYSQRSDPALKWENGVSRSYVASNFFPPLERYNPQKTDDNTKKLIPIPVVTGNAANPKLVERDFMLVFYDQANGVASGEKYESPFSLDYTVNNDGTRETSDTLDGGLFKSRGWITSFGQETGISDGEKGITEPLITYNIYGGDSSDENSNAYTIAWNTYIPKKATQCKSFGTSSNYERVINNGKQAFQNLTMTGANGEWSTENASSECNLDTDNISLATGVGIIATENGYDLTFGAGAEIFRKPAMTVKNNKTYIIKWYELY